MCLKFLLDLNVDPSSTYAMSQLRRSGRKDYDEFGETAEVGLDFQAVGGNTCGFGGELQES